MTILILALIFIFLGALNECLGAITPSILAVFVKKIIFQESTFSQNYINYYIPKRSEEVIVKMFQILYFLGVDKKAVSSKHI